MVQGPGDRARGLPWHSRPRLQGHRLSKWRPGEVEELLEVCIGDGCQGNSNSHGVLECLLCQALSQVVFNHSFLIVTPQWVPTTQRRQAEPLPKATQSVSERGFNPG